MSIFRQPGAIFVGGRRFVSAILAALAAAFGSGAYYTNDATTDKYYSDDALANPYYAEDQ